MKFIKKAEVVDVYDVSDKFISPFNPEKIFIKITDSKNMVERPLHN